MSNYNIGFAKPPKASQFKKGQSGNPKGRPKGAKTLTSNGLDMYHKPVKLLQNGKPTTISMIDAVRAKALASALKGDLKAMKLVLDEYAKLTGGKGPSSIVELTNGKSPFELSPEDEANIAKHKLLEGASD